ncbi:hypothetical protein P692DRAFT_20747603 [Suillus brevipes Sb2]|nr:hypothetical protein P692DRAFT_20747603 [Suillus brevipes Sb2]
MGTGVSPLICGSRHLPLLCRGKNQSSGDTNVTSPVSSSTSITPFIPESLTLTRHAASKSKVRNTCVSTPSPNSDGLRSPISLPSEWSLTPSSITSLRPQLIREKGRDLDSLRKDEGTLRGKVNHVITGTEDPVRSPPLIVCDSTSVANVEEVTAEATALWQRRLNETIAHGQRFRRRMVWGDEAKTLSGTALWTESAEPLPRPPPREFQNDAALNTISLHPHLFWVSTPIDVDRFESLLTLAHHPNPSFVHSVCLGLREGFWPWADTQVGVYPTTWEVPTPTPSAQLEREFIRAQISKEEAVGRYSSSFGPDLLPGMYSMPIHAVPKEGGKHRLVTNHSAGEFSLNSMIAKEDIAGVTLDNVQDLGDAIREYRRLHPNDELQIWKADVSEAYRHMPMHPLWQIKQIVSFEGERRVDRANIFGGRASQRIFHAFMSLVIWLAVFVRLIQAFIYVDDSFSFAKTSDMAYYEKYRKMLPSEMVTLLLLWDELGIPHEERKQVFGSPLPVIGFELREFARYKSKWSLRDFEHIAGSLNWALNVCPLLRPGLSAVYAKIKGKSNARGMLWINRSVVEELLWAAFHLERSDGVFLFKSISWQLNSLTSDTLRVFCDASGTGMGFWYPSLNLGFQSPLPDRSPVNDIFFTEALCVTSAIHDAVTRLPADGRLAVYTDSLNTVYMFNSLSGGQGYNRLLMDAVETILVFGVDFRVFHISGSENIVADHLSRWRAYDAELSSPGLRIMPFQPPRYALGAAKK